jgi:hypothetical protein
MQGKGGGAGVSRVRGKVHKPTPEKLLAGGGFLADFPRRCHNVYYVKLIMQ